MTLFNNFHNSVALRAVLLAALSSPLTLWAQDTGHDHVSHPAPSAGQNQAPVNVWSQGEVKRVSLSTRKITIKHGPIAVLGMDPMTMVFQFRDDEALNAAQSLKVGDKVEFVAAYDKGVYLVTRIRAAQ
jgi:Cu(I)/Ag(I) efflux system periplasmic protein CusF